MINSQTFRAYRHHKPNLNAAYAFYPHMIDWTTQPIAFAGAAARLLIVLKLNVLPFPGWSNYFTSKAISFICWRLGSVVWFVIPVVYLSKCPWARHITPKCSSDSSIGVWGRINGYLSWWAAGTLNGLQQTVCKWMNADLLCKAWWVVTKTTKALCEYSQFTILPFKVSLQA